jgi:uncharacterized protein (DUF302 family)
MKDSTLLMELKSPFNFDTTVVKILESAQTNAWNNPAIHDLQQSIAKSGKSIKPVKVIEVCKPQYSGQMLELNDERIMSILMPCRISVYEKNDGKTYIAYINTYSLSGSIPDSIAHIVKQASDDIDAVIKMAING